MRQKLTSAFIKSAPAPEADRTIYWDTGLAGFGLVVTKSGHRSFVYQYRAGHRSRRMTFSLDLGLEKARREARKALGGVASGGDPLQERRKAEGREDNTLRAISENYLKRDGKRLRSRDQILAILERLVFPAKIGGKGEMGGRQIEDIPRSDIVKLLDRIEDKNGPVMADRVLAHVRKIMNWHAARSDAFRSPIVRGMARTKPKERARKRTLNDDEIRVVWRALGTANVPPCYPAFVKSLLLCMTRRNESADMSSVELDGDVWTIPGDRYKSKLDHVVPLSAAAKALVSEKPEGVRGNSWFVFTTTFGAKPFSGFSKAKSALNKEIAKLRKADGLDPIPNWVLHDLRRTARSLMSRAGIDANIAERTMGHVIGGVRETYDRYEYLDEKRAAFEALAGIVDRIINPQPNVIPIRAAASETRE
jgi:integrase